MDHLILFHPPVDCPLSNAILSKNSSVLRFRSLLGKGERTNVYTLPKPAPTQANDEGFLLRAGECKKHGAGRVTTL